LNNPFILNMPVKSIEMLKRLMIKMDKLKIANTAWDLINEKENGPTGFISIPWKNFDPQPVHRLM